MTASEKSCPAARKLCAKVPTIQFRDVNDRRDRVQSRDSQSLLRLEFAHKLPMPVVDIYVTRIGLLEMPGAR